MTRDDNIQVPNLLTFAAWPLRNNRKTGSVATVKLPTTRNTRKYKSFTSIEDEFKNIFS